MEKNDKKCHWFDDFGICCNPFQTIPYSMKCPKKQSKCPGYAGSGDEACSKTKITVLPTKELEITFEQGWKSCKRRKAAPMPCPLTSII